MRKICMMALLSGLGTACTLLEPESQSSLDTFAPVRPSNTIEEPASRSALLDVESKNSLIFSRVATTHSNAVTPGQDTSDQDYDGVSDQEELEANTDPLDSSDAPAWHPELTYPRTVFLSDEVAGVTARLQRTDEPFRTLASRIRSSCNQSPAAYDDPDGLDQAAIYHNANIARNCAFLGYLEVNSAYISKSIEILRVFPSDIGQISAELLDNTDIHVGEALSSAAQAYDLLRADATLSSDDQTVIETNLLGLARSSFEFYVQKFPWYYRYQDGNHKSKMAAGLGMIGMTVNLNSDAARFVSYAMTELSHVLEVQTEPEGGYAEGTYYLNYASETHLPFFIAYHLYAMGDAIPYRQDCRTRQKGSGCREEDVVIPDFLTNEAIFAPYYWWLDIMMPDGMAPDFDDANRGPTFNGLLAGLTGDGRFRAAWERNAANPYYSRDCQDLSAETLVWYPPEVAAYWPDQRSFINPVAGTAAFRTGWEADAGYLLLLAENGEMTSGGHEHPDAGTILLHADGEYWVIDSGYGSWDQHYLVDSYENHSVVLVDGRGPVGYPMTTSATLENCVTDLDMDRCDARVSFPDAAWTRSVWVMDHSTYIIRDQIQSSENIQHSIEGLWHLNVEGDTGGTFEPTSSGGVGLRDAAALTVFSTSTQGTPAYDTYLDYHGPSYGVIAEHLVFTAEIRGIQAALVTLVIPSPDTTLIPQLREISSGNGSAVSQIDAADSVAMVIVNEPGVQVEVTSASGAIADITTDADFGWLKFEAGTLTAVYYESGTYLTVDGVSVIN